MKSLFNRYAWLQLILSALLILGGATIIIFALNGNQDVLADALNITIAVILFLFGGFAILASFIIGAKKIISLGLIYGSFSIALGIFLCAKELVLLEHLVYLLSVFLIVFGAVELVKAVISTIFRLQSVVVLVFTYLISVIFIVGGILSVIYRQNITQVFCVAAGAMIALVGVFLAVLGVKILIENNKKGQDGMMDMDDQPEASSPNNNAEEFDYTSKQ